MKWYVLLAAEIVLIAMFLFWCDWQNSEHNKPFPRGYWNHVGKRIASWQPTSPIDR